MEEKFVLNELDQRQGLWGWKWEAGLSSSSLQFQASLLLFPHSSCWASHLSLLSDPFLSHDCICVFIYPILTHTHFLSHLLLLLFLFFRPLIFFSSLTLSTSAKSYEASDVEKSLVTIKKNKRMLHLPMSDRTLVKI